MNYLFVYPRFEEGSREIVKIGPLGHDVLEIRVEGRKGDLD